MEKYLVSQLLPGRVAPLSVRFVGGPLHNTIREVRRSQVRVAVRLLAEIEDAPGRKAARIVSYRYRRQLLTTDAGTRFYEFHLEWGGEPSHDERGVEGPVGRRSEDCRPE